MIKRHPKHRIAMSVWDVVKRNLSSQRSILSNTSKVGWSAEIRSRVRCLGNGNPQFYSPRNANGAPEVGNLKDLKCLCDCGVPYVRCQPIACGACGQRHHPSSRHSRPLAVCNHVAGSLPRSTSAPVWLHCETYLRVIESSAVFR